MVKITFDVQPICVEPNDTLLRLEKVKLSFKMERNIIMSNKHIIEDASNTQDVFVPIGNGRHVFTLAVNSSEENSIPCNPCFNKNSWPECEYEWNGYIYIPSRMTNATIRIGADDWGTATLGAFPDKTASVDRPNPGPAGGGPFYLGTPQSLGTLFPGYYRIKITYTNISYSASRNAARCEVRLASDEQSEQLISFGSLTAVNLMTQADAEAIKLGYTKDYIPEDERLLNPDTDFSTDPRSPVCYTLCSSTNFWKMFRFSDTTYNEVKGWQTCASRMSVALNRAGYRIGIYEISNKQVSNNIEEMGGKLLILNPEKNKEQSLGKHIITAAANMGVYMKNEIIHTSVPDYSEIENMGPATDYCHEYIIRDGDISLALGPGHVALGLDGFWHVGNGLPADGEVWVLYRNGWADPIPTT